MTTVKKLEYVIDHKFDSARTRHVVNGFVNVLHCHHYATLYAQLADDAELLDGKALLVSSSEDVFYSVLSYYFRCNNITNLADRISISEQYYAATGLGKMAVLCAGRDGGEVKLLHSHIDEGWVKKWGKRDKPVNFMTQGFIKAMFSLLFDYSTQNYDVVETMSIVSGAEESVFNVVRK